MITVKTKKELALMREANRIVAVILSEIESRIRPGVTTDELDQWAEERIISLNAKPAFKGYGGYRKFPATLCTSINNEVVHGIPSESCVLKEGDILSVDVGSIYKGFYGDGARTYAVGEISGEIVELMDVCKASLEAGIAKAVEGNRIRDISIAIENSIRPHGYGIIRDLTGHGIGRNLHEEPQILNFDDGRKGKKIKTGMTFAIEPMIAMGSYEVATLDDQWTVVTADGSVAAHFEHTVAVTENGPEILTRL
jgi:methionyl aminopeptidase